MADKTELNKAHFNEHAKTYNSRFQKTIDQLIVEIQKRREWIGADWVEESDDDSVEGSSSKQKKSLRLLDYACGTGLVTRALLPYITSSTGIDLSSNMVAEFNTLAANQGLSPAEMHAYAGNLLTTTSDATFDDEKFFEFDIAVVGLGFHHFNDPTLAATKLVQRLKKGGVLVIIDFLPHGANDDHDHSHSHHGHSHDHGHGHSHGESHDSKKEKDADVANEKELGSAKHTVAHHGFSLEDVKTMFETAGAGKDFSTVELGSGVVFARSDGVEETRKDFKRSVFIARGFKL